VAPAEHRPGEQGHRPDLCFGPQDHRDEALIAGGGDGDAACAASAIVRAKAGAIARHRQRDVLAVIGQGRRQEGEVRGQRRELAGHAPVAVRMV